MAGYGCHPRLRPCRCSWSSVACVPRLVWSGSWEELLVGESLLPSPLNRILGFTISYPGVLLTHAG